MKAIGIDEVADLGSGRQDLAWVAGQPDEQQTFNEERRLITFQRLCLTCEPIAPIAWEAVREQIGKVDGMTGTLSPDIHVLFYYDLSEPTYWPFEDTRATDSTPKPFGMSGGGVWQFPSATDSESIWSPDSLRLFAIQSSWPKRGKHLKAIQVIHWIRLVADTYPEMRDKLRQRFPRIADATR
jgi:hypothetical protein